MDRFVMAIASSIIISLTSLVGIILFRLRKNLLKKELMILVGLATGALLGDAFLHLIPEAFESNNSNNVGLWVVVGMMMFFALEKFLKWRHCHDLDCHEENRVAWMNLAADSVHNLIDGLIIGGSFMTSTSLGITTSIAVLMHEIPQEIGDMGILIHSGFSLKKAALMNLLTAFFNLLGVLIIWIIGAKGEIDGSILAVTAGGFIYLAASDLIPELHRHESKVGESAWQLITVITGVMVMYLI